VGILAKGSSAFAEACAFSAHLSQVTSCIALDFMPGCALGVPNQMPHGPGKNSSNEARVATDSFYGARIQI
jgi:hypothetical protein